MDLSSYRNLPVHHHRKRKNVATMVDEEDLYLQALELVERGYLDASSFDSFIAQKLKSINRSEESGNHEAATSISSKSKVN